VSAFQPGDVISGRYRLMRVMGAGAMGVVWSARNESTERDFAIKLMLPEAAKDPQRLSRFFKEAKLAGRLRHRCIVEVYDLGRIESGPHAGAPYLVMELLDGEPLDAIIGRGPLPLPRALPIMIQVARGIARAHDLEVIHRDLKPENIYIARRDDGTDLVKLLDFGIARSAQDSRLTGVGEVFGTPQYMAPERITSIDAGGSQDLYALGVIFFEMITGTLPFEANDVPSFLLKHLKEPPPKISDRGVSVPRELEMLIDSLMAKDPKQRPVDAHKVHNELMGIAQQLGITPPPEISEEQRAGGRAPAATLPPVTIDRWARRVTVFEQMLQRAYPAGAPNEQRNTLERVRKFVNEVAQLRGSSVEDQRKLEALEGRQREGRERFGRAVDALGIDASKARDVARGAREGVKPYTDAVTQAREMATKTHGEVLHWEGRSGMAMPYGELANAYRKMAEIVDHWLKTVEFEKQAIAWAEAKEQEVADLDFQIQELRAQLGKFEQSLEQEHTQIEQKVIAASKKASELEEALLELAQIFCAPLRAKPELAPLFTELEAESAAA
jgi:serine/threonine-protein kinase